MEQLGVNIAAIDNYININNQLDLKQQIDSIINEIGISEHFKGYRFIIEALNLVVKDIDMLSAIAKELYPVIAKKFNTTPSRVERDIRYAIEVAWSGEEANAINKLLAHTLKNKKSRPTNKKLIATLAYRLRRINKIA